MLEYLESFGDNEQMKEDNRPQPYSLRVEPELRAKLEALAKASGRSLNTQIVLMLEAALDAYGVKPTDMVVFTPEEIEEIRRIATESAIETTLDLVRKEINQLFGK